MLTIKDFTTTVAHDDSKTIQLKMEFSYQVEENGEPKSAKIGCVLIITPHNVDFQIITDGKDVRWVIE